MKISALNKTIKSSHPVAVLLCFAMVFFAGATAAQAPQNDNCFSTPNLFTLSCGMTVAGSTVNATADNVPTCGSAGVPGIGVWYLFQGTGSPVTFGTCDDNTNFDTKISVYTGSCGSLTCVGGNDNFCGNKARVNVNTVSGTLYRILVHGANGATGNFAIRVLCNETCASPILLTPAQTVMGSNIGSVAETPFPPNCGVTDGTAGDVWYSIIGTGSTATLHTCVSSSFDTQLSVFTGNCGSLSCVAANDNSTCGNSSLLTFPTTYNTLYRVRVNGANNAQGVFNLTLIFTLPENDQCANAILVGCNSETPGTSAGAVPETVPTCNLPITASPSVWYKFVGTGGTATVSTCNLMSPPTFDTKIRVYTGSCNALACVASNDNSIHCINGSSRTSFQTTAGTTYRIRVDGAVNQSGNFVLSVNNCSSSSGGDGTELFAEDGIMYERQPDAMGLAFSLAPNPTSGKVNFSLPPLSQAHDVILEVFDLIGRRVLRKEFSNVDFVDEQLDLTGLAKGTYLMAVQAGTQRAVQRLVVGTY